MGEFIPAVAHCRLQGIANSPTSAALSKATTLIYYKIFECATQFFSLQKRKMCYNKQGQKNAWAISSAGRAPGSQSRGQGFDPPMVHHKIPNPAVLEIAGFFLFFSLVYHVFQALSFFAFAEIATPLTTLLNTNKRHFYERIYERLILPAEFSALLLKLRQI